MKRYFLPLFIAFLPLLIWAQPETEMWDRIEERLHRQAELFPQEKIYLHRDKESYVAGERIWLRPYVVSAMTHRPMDASRYVYVELIAPDNEVVDRVRLRNIEGQCSGYVDIPANLPQGDYFLRAYTAFMQNLDEGYFYRDRVFISAPGAAGLDISPQFEYSGTRLAARFTVENNGGHSSPGADGVKFFYGQKEVPLVRNDGDSLFRFEIRNVDDEPEVIKLHYGSFRKYFDVPSREGRYDVSFYPEGGNLVPGKVCRVGFKALYPDGSPAQVDGIVLDGKGSEVSRLKTHHNGMGAFTLECTASEEYKVECTDAEGNVRVFYMPVAVESAVSLKVDRFADSLAVALVASDGRSRQGHYLAAHCRGDLLFVGSFDDTDIFLFPQESFPPGVIHFMVVDGDLNIYGERLWFSMNGYRTDAVITTDKREYRLREKVDLGIEVPGSDGVSPAFMSVSVTDDSDVSAVPESSVFTSLLLASDLRGYIEYPGFYFAPGLLREVALDILMMVNGWRRYEVSEVLRGEFAIPEHPLEVGQELSGRVDYAVRDRAMEGSRVSMISFPDSFFDTTVTGGDGTFAFNGFELPDSTVFVVQALNRRGRKLAVLYLDEQVFPEVGQQLPVRRFRYSLNAPYLQKADRKYTDEHGIRIIDIDEVSVRGNRRAPGNLYSYDFADNLYEEEQLGNVKGTFEDFMRRLPRVMFERNVPLMQERGGRYRPINYIVDGIMLFDDYFSVRHIPMHSIKSIVVYNPDNIYYIPGLRQGGGTVAIETKTGDGTPLDIHFNVAETTPLGYQLPVEFYSPVYDTPSRRNNGKADLRTTIFWDPEVILDGDGPAQLTFYTSDAPTTYSITVQGVTEDGGLIGTGAKLTVTDRYLD